MNKGGNFKQALTYPKVNGGKIHYIKQNIHLQTMGLKQLPGVKRELQVLIEKWK